MKTGIADAGALLAELARGEASSAELTRAALARIEALNPALNAIVALDADAALAQAAASDERRRAGAAGPLEGLPITIKDAWDVAGLASTAGAPALAGRVPDADAAPVARLRRAGAVILGKTNVPVFCGDFVSANPLHGQTANPWDTARSPGGSSGGAAVAVATGMSAFELGSDLGGSIRWPAHATGIYGLKTTWGLVSTYGHVPPPPDKRTARNVDLMVAGPLARSAADLDLILPVIAGPREGGAVPVLLPPRKREPKGLRVALWVEEPFAPAQAAVRAGVRRAAELLAAEGALVSETARPAFRFAEAYEVSALLNHAVVAYGLPVKVRSKLMAMAGSALPGDLSHAALQARGARMTPGLYQQLQARRLALKRAWARFFTQWDVVLCPPAPVVAVPHPESADLRNRFLEIDGTALPWLDFLVWSSLATGADLPAASAPVMLTGQGWPTGVQIIAAHGEDRTAIAVAGMIGELTGGIGAPPFPT